MFLHLFSFPKVFSFYSYSLSLSLSIKHLMVKNSSSSFPICLFYIRSEIVMEVVNEQKQKDLSSPPFPSNHSGDGLDIHSSPSLTDGGNSLAQASPANTSFGHVSASDNSSFIQNNGSCSPDVHLRHKITSHPPVVDGEEKYDSMVIQRPKSVGKCAESNAALSSFEAMLGTLTRTKESIGRATRVAIDCAKLGVSSKVQNRLSHISVLFNSNF